MHTIDFTSSILIGTSVANASNAASLEWYFKTIPLPPLLVLSQLHWLPIIKQIKFVIATLVYVPVACFWSADLSLSIFGINTSSASVVPPLL